MKNQSKRMFLSAIAAILLMSGVSTQASLAAGEYVQAAACGSATCEYIQTGAGAVVTLDRKGTMWKGTNSKEGDKCGLILFLGDQKHIMVSNRDSELVFDSLTDEVKDNTTVTCVFKPQLGQPDLITITKPLKELRFGQWSGHPIAYLPRNIFNQAGVADLKRLTVTYTGKGSLVFRHFSIECESNSCSTLHIHLTPTLDCAALTAQK